MNGRPDDLRLLGELLDGDPFYHLWGRRLAWVRSLSLDVAAWEMQERPPGPSTYVWVFARSSDERRRDLNVLVGDLARGRLLVEVLARCEDPAAVLFAASDAPQWGRSEQRLPHLFACALRSCDLAEDGRLVRVLEASVRAWDGSLDELVDVARLGVLS